MTIDEYTEKLTECVTNPDSAPAIIKDIISELKTDFTSMDTIKTKVAEQETKIKNLQETNMKLFIGQTGKPEKEEVTEDYNDLTGMDAVDAFMKGNEIDSLIDMGGNKE